MNTKLASIISKISHYFWTLFMAILLPLALLSCQSPHTWSLLSPTSYQYGLQDPSFQVIPSSIAVLPCQGWPAYEAEQRLEKIEKQEPRLEEFCEQVDQFILRSFMGQPHIHGKSPGKTLSLLAEHEKSGLWDDFFKLWHVPETCTHCHDFLTYYHELILPQKEWRFFLRDFQSATKYSDAILIPFLSEVRQTQKRYKGNVQWLRRIHMVVFLISSEDGHMIWARTHGAGAVRSLPHWPLDPGTWNQNSKKSAASPPSSDHYPPWQDALERLWSPNLWHDFPGWIPPFPNR